MAGKRAVFLGAMLAFGLLASPAVAAETTVNCAGLQNALNKAANGDRITLDELCKSGFPYKLPGVAFTLAGTPGAGFDGGSTTQLEGSGSAPVIEGLIFENARSTITDTAAGLSLNVAPNGSAVTLAHDTFVNDVASGSESAGGARINTASANVTVSNSTFTGNSTIDNGGALVVFGTTVTLSGDTFTGNSATGPNGIGGGLYASTVEGPLTLTGSQFSGNTAVAEGGGALLETQDTFTLTGNTFSANSVADPGGTSKGSRGYLGGGLSLQGEATQPRTAVQRGNTFDGNRISFKAAPVNAWGAGESTSHVVLQSTGDRFTNNTLQSPGEAKNGKGEHVWGWGAGLSVVECGETTEEPSTVPNVVSTLANAAVAHNTLLSGPSANGAGIYVGFACPLAYTTLQVSDSTITANVVSGSAGPVAGISGGPHDVLNLANTILLGDGGPELGGFSALAGVTATFSDVCSGAAPFAGAGNLCADPKLVAPSSADVHETGSSPTLERGSNALVTAGLGSDVYGGPRILGPIGCGSSPAPVVDIGAAEYAYPVPPCAPPTGPVISGLRQSAKKWRAGRAAAHLSAVHHAKRPPVGTTFSFKLDVPATVTMTFTTSAQGRRAGGKCVAKSKRNSHAKRCSRTIVAGVLTLKAHAGTNKVRFDGVISRRKHLRPGAYTLRARALGGPPASALHFTIVR